MIRNKQICTISYDEKIDGKVKNSPKKKKTLRRCILPGEAETSR